MLICKETSDLKLISGFCVAFISLKKKLLTKHSTTSLFLWCTTIKKNLLWSLFWKPRYQPGALMMGGRKTLFPTHRITTCRIRPSQKGPTTGRILTPGGVVSGRIRPSGRQCVSTAGWFLPPAQEGGAAGWLLASGYCITAAVDACTFRQLLPQGHCAAVGANRWLMVRGLLSHWVPIVGGACRWLLPPGQVVVTLQILPPVRVEVLPLC